MPTGMTTSYDLPIGVKVLMDEMLYMIAAQDSPLLTGVDSDGMSLISTENIDQVEYSWLHDGILTPRSTLGSAALAGDTFVALAAGDRIKFSTGDIARVVNGAAEEYVRVTGYGTTADTLLLTRGFDGTGAKAAPQGAKFIGLGTALAEGSDPEQPRTLDRTKYSNNTQIFGPTSVHMSRTEQKVSRYGVPNEFNHQLGKRIVENGIHREQVGLYGRRYNSADSTVRTTGGILQYITSNVNTTSTELTLTAITTMLQAIYAKGGSAKTLMANPFALATLNDVNNTSVLSTTYADTRRGRASVQTVTTEFGDLVVARNRWLEPTDAIIFNREQVTRMVFDPLQAERLAKTGDSDKMQIVCEEGWKVKGQEHLAAFRGLTAYTSNY